MNKIELDQFAKGKVKESKQIKTAVVYTRVSTKEQADNNQSLETQAKYIKSYAVKNTITVIGEFGGTYESAKTDERIEFKKMLVFAKRKKVDLILVYSIDRFSRSGPNAIYISEQLRKAKIGIMSVTQPLDAMTASGELQQSIYFVFSQYENQQRREKCMAGSKEMLLKGEWPTKPPVGYEITRVNGKREIIVNEKGVLLRSAFRQKLKYDTSFKQLSMWLKKRGLNISHKRLSEMSRNVFYCGYMSHSSLDGQMVKGNHQGIITKEEFLRLNNLLESKYTDRRKKNKSQDENLPLKGHLICSGCQTKLTGYLVKKKNLYYYKCNIVGCKHNKSANQIHNNWQEHLKELQVDKKYLKPITDNYSKLLDTKQEEAKKDVSVLRKQATGLTDKIEKLEERFVLGAINIELYQKYRVKYNLELSPISEEIKKIDKTVSNHKKLTEGALQTLCNLLTIWDKADFDTKQKLLKAVYPEGIVLDKKNNDYRTNNVNVAIRCIQGIARDLENKKKRNNQDEPSYSALVARSRIELPTSGL